MQSFLWFVHHSIVSMQFSCAIVTITEFKYRHKQMLHEQLEIERCQ